VSHHHHTPSHETPSVARRERGGRHWAGRGEPSHLSWPRVAQDAHATHATYTRGDGHGAGDEPGDATALAKRCRARAAHRRDDERQQARANVSDDGRSGGGTNSKRQGWKESKDA